MTETQQIYRNIHSLTRRVPRLRTQAQAKACTEIVLHEIRTAHPAIASAIDATLLRDDYTGPLMDRRISQRRPGSVVGMIQARRETDALPEFFRVANIPVKPWSM